MPARQRMSCSPAAASAPARQLTPRAGVQLCEQALALAPQHAEALYCLGCAAMAQRNLPRAAYFYEATLAQAPSCAEAWNNLGAPAAA